MKPKTKWIVAVGLTLAVALCVAYKVFVVKYFSWSIPNSPYKINNNVWGLPVKSPLGRRRDSWIDQYNNARAREIAIGCGGCTAEELRRRIEEALRDGTLHYITDPCDPLIPPELRDCDGDGIPASEDDCDIPPQARGAGLGSARADVDGDGVVTILDAVGTQDATKEQTDDCWVWIDDVEAVLEGSVVHNLHFIKTIHPLPGAVT